MARGRFFLPTTFSCCAKMTSWNFAGLAPPAASASNGLARCARTAWTPAVAEAMRAAECQRIYFGVESGSDRILREAQKGMTTAQIRRGIRAALDAGLRVKTGWIYGLPGSLEEQYKSIPFMLDLRPHEISIHQLIPFPRNHLLHRPGALRHSDRGPQGTLRAFVMADSTAASSSII